MLLRSISPRLFRYCPALTQSSRKTGFEDGTLALDEAPDALSRVVEVDELLTLNPDIAVPN